MAVLEDFGARWFTCLIDKSPLLRTATPTAVLSRLVLCVE